MSRTAFPILLAVLACACSPKNDWHNVTPPSENIFEKHFGLSASEQTVEQQKYDENKVSVTFRVQKDGRSVNNLKESDVRIQENGVPVPAFSLSADTERIQQVADIVFLVDITGTMVELIESAKERLAAFIKSSRTRGFHTRMCISTFGDYTVKKCSRFFDNNPGDKSTESQVTELLSELAQIQAYRGVGKDPGWPDLDENPMGALVDASKAPWGQDSQRFVILVTDWGFLYSPNNQGTIGDKAPAMKQVTEAIKASQMKVFAVTRMQHDHKGEHLVWDGYNTPFQDEPGIVQSSDGEYFDFDKVLKGEISLDHIMERILERLNTIYKATYVVDQTPGLNPTLRQDQRDVKVSMQNADAGEVVPQSVRTTMPKGRPEYKRTWKIADEALRPDTVHVFVDGQELNQNDISTKNGEVTLKDVPPAGSKIRFHYLYEKLEKHLRLEPVVFSEPVDESSTIIYLNGIEARKGDVTLANTLEGNTSLTLTESALEPGNPYEIGKNKGLTVKVVVSCGGTTKQGFLESKRKTICVKQK